MKLKSIIVILFLASTVSFVEAEQDGELDLATADLGEIDRALNNPLTSIWSLTFQNNTSTKTGDAVDGTEYSNTLLFQPFMPFELGEEKKTMMTLRPVFPLVTQPTFDASDSRNSSGHTTGLGDIQLLTLFGPNKGQGFVWGAGGTFIFPTATDEVLGQEKWQAGPSLMLFYMGKPWVGGILAQHWEADSKNALTLPIGLGITKTTRWGNQPFKFRAEIQYSIVKPEDYGTEWNLRLQITPVINSPMNTGK